MDENLQDINNHLAELNQQKRIKEETIRKLNLIKEREAEIKQLDRKLHPRNYQKLLSLFKKK